VVATFVTQTAQNLQQDYNKVTVSLLTELVSLQRAVVTGGNTSAVTMSSQTVDSTFNPDQRDIYLNGLWFGSLGLTLATALITGLIKQWIHYYVADITGTPKVRACTRQFRYMGLSLWGVSPIIELLPVLMNASLLLFFAGLILFLQGLSGTAWITLLMIALTCVLFFFYVGTSFLPLWNPQCPYKSSLTAMWNLFIKTIWAIIKKAIV
jgi:hypothetical protein